MIYAAPMAVVIKAYREGLSLQETHTYGLSVTEFWVNGRQLAQPPGDLDIRVWSTLAAHASRFGWIPATPFIQKFRERAIEADGDLHGVWSTWAAANPPEDDPPLVLDPGASVQ